MTQALCSGYRRTDRVLGPPRIELRTAGADPAHEGGEGYVAKPKVVRRTEQ